MQKNYESNYSNGIPWSLILGSETNHHKLLQKHFKESINATANHLGVSFEGLKHKLKKEYLQFPTKKKLVYVIRAIGDVSNMTSTEIGEILNCPQESVARVCKKNEIKYKKRIGLNNLIGVQRKGLS